MVRVVTGGVLFAAFGALLVTGLMREANVECAVCMEFEGRRACRSSLGADRDAAISGAISTACAVLAGGVTRGIQCSSTPPKSLHCDD